MLLLLYYTNIPPAVLDFISTLSYLMALFMHLLKRSSNCIILLLITNISQDGYWNKTLQQYN